METTNNNLMKNFDNVHYVILEDKVCYDFDDYGVWGAIVYNVDTKKVEVFTYGHGVDLEIRNQSVTLREAVENSIVSLTELSINISNQRGFGFNKNAFFKSATCHSFDNPLDVPVKIVGGRKGKGKEGRLVYISRVPVRYGLGAYQNAYSLHPVVWVRETNEFITINSTHYLEFDNAFVNAYEASIKGNIESTFEEVRSLAHIWAYEMSYASIDRDNCRDAIHSYCKRGMSVAKVISEELKDALAERKERLNKEYDERIAKLREEHMPNIIEWVKTKTDKEGDDIMKLAEHIFNKRYA